MGIYVDTPPVKLSPRQEEVWGLLHDGRWHLGSELSNARTGGSEGLRRLRELRTLGFTFEKKWAKSLRHPRNGNRLFPNTRDQYAYRLTGFEGPDPRDL